MQHRPTSQSRRMSELRLVLYLAVATPLDMPMLYLVGALLIVIGGLLVGLDVTEKRKKKKGAVGIGN